jgi:hypothetical protein
MSGLWWSTLLGLILAVQLVAGSRSLAHVTEEDWRDMLKGEWMVEFYAPWCPACKDMAKTWSSFADWSKDLEIKVAAVDVTTNPGLSGRFLVTALPTIYHVKDGVFRQYSGPRDKDDFIAFIEEKKWTVVDPVANWKHPDTPQMAVVAMFFRLSMAVRDLHNHLVDKRGLPPVASYLVFGLATLVLGCVLGFLIVCLIDCVFPASGAKGATMPPPKEEKKEKKKEKKQKEKEKEEKARASQSEGDATQSQTEEESSADEGGEGDVRRRKKEKKEEKPMANGKTPEGKKKK